MYWYVRQIPDKVKNNRDRDNIQRIIFFIILEIKEGLLFIVLCISSINLSASFLSLNLVNIISLFSILYFSLVIATTSKLCFSLSSCISNKNEFLCFIVKNSFTLDLKYSKIGSKYFPSLFDDDI